MIDWWQKEPQKYEQDILAGALLLHGVANGTANADPMILVQVERILDTRLSNWIDYTSDRHEFDDTAKRLVEIALSEYRSSALYALSTQNRQFYSFGLPR
jgi:hypothetical protein